MADWSELPLELLTLIVKRLEARFDVLRFQSVCSSWRSSFPPPKVHHLPERLPLETIGTCGYSLRHINKNTLYLVRLPGAILTAPQAACWLVSIRDGTKLLKPLSDSGLKPLPANFPKVLDLTNFQVIELGHQFFGQYSFYINNRNLIGASLSFRWKVAIMWSSSNSTDFMMIPVFHQTTYSTLREHVDGVEDIISFNGKFYAIEKRDRTVVIDQSLNVSFIQQFRPYSMRKFLVQSGDNLLAVEMFSVSDAESPVSFRILRFNEEEQKWDGIHSLGDQILFVGDSQAISASASEFYWFKGNLIFYWSWDDSPLEHPNSDNSHMFVFDLETGTTRLVKNCPAYCNLSWLPSEWVTSAESPISSTQVISNSSATPRQTEHKSPERMAFAGQVVSPRSKCRFKFCSF